MVKERLSILNQTFSKGTVKTRPRITIAKNIFKEKAQILWLYFKDLKFEYSFYAGKINVLETPTRRFFNLPMRSKAEIELAAAT